MSSNQITVVGNVVDSPVRRRAGSGEVTKFRMASTDRWFDSGSGQWVDGDTFYVDVDCWNTLGAHVSGCVVKGDPVVVVGRIATSEYEVDGAKRSRPVIRAAQVGHDLSRGSAVFKRTPRAVVAGAEGAPAESADPADVPADATEEQLASAGAPF
ncbi:single-strand DNA-binding protein [Klenkia marina]|uniref:Single-stranded DNA-binding protein n=1 Tax=Klenkia marina TaxID=1960309 RepID=A0A1G4Y5W5_9ACTN|nr:single-stranded DNA-binding protein [Klenkia marina]SCX48769.1 single-strand DNA-binding protein [Klenkia marina]